MLLLVTIGLVLVAAVTLVIGFVSNTLPLIYGSIVCSVLAAVVLFLYSRLGRRRAAPAAAGSRASAVPASRSGRRSTGADTDTFAPAPRRGPKVVTGAGTSVPAYEPSSDDAPTRQFRAPRRAPKAAAEPAPAPAPAPPSRVQAAPVAAAPVEDAADAAGPVLASLSSRPAPVDVPAAGVPEADEGSDEVPDSGDEPFFPIEDYDSLGVSEILPLLFELDDQELAEVAAYEEAGLGRADILARIDALLAEPAAEGPEAGAADDGDAEAELEAAELPIADYDTLAVADILPLLVELDDEELWDVRDYEVAGQARIVITNRIDALIDGEAYDQEEELTEAEAIDQGPGGPGQELPIADYDRLMVHEILPLLAELDDNELWDVRDHEEAGSNRITIMARIDLLLGGEELEPDTSLEVAEPVAYEPAAAEEPAASDDGFPIADYDHLGVTAIAQLLGQLDEDELAEVRDYEDSGLGRVVILNRINALLGIEQPEPAAAEARRSEEPAPEELESEGAAEGSDEDHHDGFPIADYDDMGVTAILPLLAELEDDELAEVRDHEESGAGRVVIMNRIDALLGVEPGQGDDPDPDPDPAGPADPASDEPGPADEAFPIADYDELAVTAILPLLAELEDDELDEVRDHEEAGQSRVVILNRIDALLEVEVADGDEDLGGVAEEEEFEEADEDEEGAGGVAPGAEYDFPIADYDELAVTDILTLLAELDDDELEDVRDYEEAGQGRVVVVNRIDALLEVEADDESPEADIAAEVDDEFEDEDPEDGLDAPAGPDPGDVEPRVEDGFEQEEDDGGGEAPFPIADYDDLRVAEILPLLSQLMSSELEQVAEREEAGANRTTVLNRIDRLLRVGGQNPQT